MDEAAYLDLTQIADYEHKLELAKRLTDKIQTTATEVQDQDSGSLNLNQAELVDLLQLVFGDTNARKIAVKAGLILPPSNKKFTFNILGGTPTVQFKEGKKGIHIVQFTADNAECELGFQDKTPAKFHQDSIGIQLANQHDASKRYARIPGHIEMVGLRINPEIATDKVPNLPLGQILKVPFPNIFPLINALVGGSYFQRVLQNTTVPIIAANDTDPTRLETTVKGMEGDILPDSIQLTYFKDRETPTSAYSIPGIGELIPNVKGFTFTKPLAKA